MNQLTRLFLIVAFALHLPASAQEKDDFDRLDGKGASGKRVDVIEWEGNLEIHVYPKGSLAGLALKLDDRAKDKPVMVIGYRFDKEPKKQLIRRAIIGVPFTAKFKAFRDAKEPDFDKIVISCNTLSGDLAEYKLDPEPTQLYPEDPTKNKKVADRSPQHTQADSEGGSRRTASEEATQPANGDEEGLIKPFQW